MMKNTNKKLIIIIVLMVFLIVIIPFLIHVMYKIPAKSDFFIYEIPAGNLLTYIGSLLTFGATFSLSLIIYFQNKENEKKMLLFQNRVFVAIDEKRGVDIEIKDMEKMQMISIVFYLKVLKDAIISEVRLNEIRLRNDEIHIEDEFAYDFKEHSGKVLIRVQYLETNSVSFLTGFFEEIPKIEEFIKKWDNISIVIQADIVCDKVVTPIIIYLYTKKKNNYEYIISNSSIHHWPARFDD